MTTISSTPGFSPAAYSTPGSGVQADTRTLQRFLDNALAGTQLRFRVENDIGRVVVQVLDVKSGEVLRQIPPDEAVRLARRALDGPSES